MVSIASLSSLENVILIKEEVIMTQKDIDVMDLLVSKIAEGAKLSKALKLMYKKRNVAIPFSEEMFNVDLNSLGLSARTMNALAFVGAKTINDVIVVNDDITFEKIRNFGRISQIELFEAILDYSWEHMTKKERAAFLIDTVDRNSHYLKDGLV